MSTPEISGVTTSWRRERIEKPTLLLLSCLLIGTWCFNRFTLLVPLTENACLPATWFLLDRADRASVERGQIATFAIQGTRFPDNLLFSKLVAAQSGDAFEVQPQAVITPHITLINNQREERERFQLDVRHVKQRGVVPDHHFFAMGTLPNSYDSRYWGLVDQKTQLKGKTYVLF